MIRFDNSDCGMDFGIGLRKSYASRRLRRSLAVSAGVLSLLAGFAWAADLPTQKGPAPVPAPPPAYSWTGFYIGVNGGYGWSNSNKESNNVFPFIGAVPDNGFIPVSGNNNGGFVGGIQGGYNYQFGAGQGFVLGVEADIDHANLGRQTNNVQLGSFMLPQFPGTDFTPLAAARSNNTSQYIGTVRLRAGYAWDRLLVYGTGGIAYGGIRNGNGFGGGLSETTQPGFADPVTGVVDPVNPQTNFVGAATTRSSSSRAGWALGLGSEYAVWNNLSVKAEYLYLNFDNGRSSPAFFLPGAAAVANTNRGRNVNIVRLGLNLRFW